MASICNHIVARSTAPWGVLNVNTATGSLPKATDPENNTITSSALDHEIAWFMYNFTDELKKCTPANQTLVLEWMISKLYN
jgi:hypothetical protein